MKKIILLLLILALCACKKAPTHADQDYSNYFPMELGNKWTYSNPLSTITQTHRIWETRIYNNQIFSLWGNEQVNSVPLRYENSKIFRIQNNQKMLWFDFTKNENETYFYQPSENVNYTVTVTHDITVECGNKSWNNCMQFYFDDAEMTDEEMSYILAPDIGIVQITGTWVNLCLNDYELHE